MENQNQQQEIWKDVKGYEGLYQISSWGRVKSCDKVIPQCFKDSRGKVDMHRKGKIMKISVYKRDGYCYISLSKNGVKKKYKIHRLVAMAFIENPKPKEFDMVNHIDGITNNNNVNNLKWCDNRQNQEHAIRIGLNKRVGINSYWSKLTEEQVKFIRENYKPRGKYNFCTLSKMFNVTPTTIQNVIVGNTYYVVK